MGGVKHPSHPPPYTWCICYPCQFVVNYLSSISLVLLPLSLDNKTSLLARCPSLSLSLSSSYNYWMSLATSQLKCFNYTTRSYEWPEQCSLSLLLSVFSLYLIFLISPFLRTRIVTANFYARAKTVESMRAATLDEARERKCFQFTFKWHELIFSLCPLSSRLKVKRNWRESERKEKKS